MASGSNFETITEVHTKFNIVPLGLALWLIITKLFGHFFVWQRPHEKKN